MICSFSVPENERNKRLIQWYKSYDSQERSRKIREILSSYLNEDRHIIEKPAPTYVSQRINSPNLAMIDITASQNNEIDLESRLDSIGILGGGYV